MLKRLARDSDAVLMDLRGFLPDNQGCVFEINELLNVVPLDRVVFVVDATTDLAFLRETFATGWAALAAESPNHNLAEPRVLLFEFAGEKSVPGLMRAVGRGPAEGRQRGGCRLSRVRLAGWNSTTRPGRHLNSQPASSLPIATRKERFRSSAMQAASTPIIRRCWSRGIGDTGAPTLCLWGVHDPWQTIADGERLSREIPNARFVRVENASHSIPHDTPEAFAHELSKFLQRE